jgi:hypothetical protein
MNSSRRKSVAPKKDATRLKIEQMEQERKNRRKVGVSETVICDG